MGLGRWIAVAAMLLSSSAWAQQPAPADMGITPTTVPEVLQVLDKNRVWTPIGTVQSGTFLPQTNGTIPTGHCLRWAPGLADAGAPPCGTPASFSGLPEADILVTDPSIGMVANTGQDNSPFVSALMTKQMPAAWGGYDVLFPAIPGQTQTVYYFSQPFLNSRTGNYHCSGSVGYLSTYLVFAAGVDGFVQDMYTNTPDGGLGGGILSSCYVVSLGFGGAYADTATPTKLTSVSFTGIPGASLPAQSWHVGDGLLLTSSNGYFSSDVIFSVPIGTTITAVDGTTGDLTMSNPVTQSLGTSFAPKATATFTQTGSNNFLPNDTIKVGSITYTFRNYCLYGWCGSVAPHDVLLGANFAASANNLVAAINGWGGQFSLYGPSTSGEDAFSANLLINASYASGVITFTSNYGPPNANSYPSIYTHTGTAAGAFGGATFSGANATSGSIGMAFWQFPVAQEFKVRTTVGSPNVTVISGPRLLKGGDVIWSDAFRFGTTIDTASGTVGAQTLHMTNAAQTAGDANATVTHAPGAEGNLWIFPAGLKRRTPANATHDYFAQWPIGLQMSCGSNSENSNCDLSRDQENNHDNNFVGRWVAGNNTATATSMSDQFAHNFLMDTWEGGTLGEIYYNYNSESPETQTSKYSMVQNCANQNYSMIFGAYMGGGPGCSFDGYPFPPTYGGVTVHGTLAQLNANTGAPAINRNTYVNGISVIGGPDQAQCVDLTGPANVWWVIAFSFGGCGNTGTELALQWNGGGTWAWTMGGPATSPVMSFLNTSWGYGGYAGPTGKTTLFPTGILLADYDSGGGNGLLSMSGSKPFSTPRQTGDVTFNTGAGAGGAAAWYDAGGTWLPAAPIANDAAGTQWTLGNYMTLTPVALASLPATCAAGTFAVINNGVAAPVYNAAVGVTTGAATDPVFCTNGNVWKYH